MVQAPCSLYVRVRLTLQITFLNIYSTHYAEYYDYIFLAAGQAWIRVSARLLSRFYTEKYCHKYTIKIVQL